MAFSEEVIARLQQLESKYQAMGQDLVSYLDGLLYADYLTYWDYIHLDTLLSLQNTRTPFPDEKIFVIYHQITELYFKLCLHEMEQLRNDEQLTSAILQMRVERMNRYFEALVQSFEIMVDGMDPKQFLKYRMSLLPASGFQSAQYRMIEIGATAMINLVDKAHREALQNANVEVQFEKIYWQWGATELASGKKTLTLNQFEKKYNSTLLNLAKTCEYSNLYHLLMRFADAQGEVPEALKSAFRKFDLLVNVNWPLAHFKSAVRYLHKDPEDIKATGGTNWQKYLPPRFQKRIFFPNLWSDSEMENWGKAWVHKEVFGKDKEI